MAKVIIPTQALHERVYQQLKNRIIDCDILPGEVLSEDQLSAEFGTSRTPVREALLRLQRENLVVIYPRQGTFASQISLKDIYEIYQIRLFVEPQVAKLASRVMDSDTLNRFKDLFTRQDSRSCDFKSWFHHDREFHSYIIRSSKNQKLIQIYEAVMDQNQRMRILAGRLPSRIDSTNSEHAGIVEALFSRDEDKIEKMMTSHIIASRDAALKIDQFIEE